MILITHGVYKEAIWLLAIPVVIDGFDGTLARKFDIKSRLPSIDGTLLDNIVDYFTWTITPLFWGFEVLHISWTIACICAIASLFGFTNIHAKSEDHYFTGFPSYWNLVIFHLFVLGVSPLISNISLLVCAIFVFIPLKWIYPSRTQSFQKTTLFLSAIYFVQIVSMLILYTETPMWLALTSLIFPMYYVTFSVFLNFKHPQSIS